ncbi:MAG: phosphate acetyltransferase, partial [Spirochaetales bacterium]|nr:phosphate acetyltransferase [Spirochaetales bacterium]
MSFPETMISKAVAMKKKLVLPEGTEPRTLAAARIIMDKGIAAEIFLVGAEEEVRNVAEENNVDLSGIKIINPATSELLPGFVNEYFELRKHKKISLKLAEKIVKTPLSWGAMMLRKGIVDGMVAGAENSTGNVLISSFTKILFSEILFLSSFIAPKEYFFS